MNKYNFEVRPVWTQQVEAKTKNEAIKKLKDSIEMDFNFYPDDKEIKEIK